MEQKKTVLFYKYYFEYGVDEPIIIEALNKNEADEFLRQHKRYLPAPISSLHVSRPLFGITKKEERGIVYIWCGFENSHNGWMEENKFNALSYGIIK